jgi:hypothetical protein
MKTLLINVLTIIVLFLLPNVNFGQIAPDLGTSSNFALFTAAGAFANTGTSTVTGDIGTKVGAFDATGITLDGNIYLPGSGVANAAGDDVLAAYAEMSTMGGSVLGVGLGNGQILNPGVYNTGAASTMNGELILDGEGDPNALFIIRIGGAFSTGVASTVTLINSASWCNVYWQIGGQFDLGASSVFVGTAIVGGAIHLASTSSIQGRGLATAGEITLDNNIVIIPKVSDAGTIVGPTSVCEEEAGVVYSVPVITNATGYLWTIPSGASITAGDNTNSITVDFGTATDGILTVQGTDVCGNGLVSPDFSVTVNPLPLTTTIYHQ